MIGTPVSRPRIGTPIATPATVTTPSPSDSASSGEATPKPVVSGAAPRPTIGTPVGSRPPVGTPVGSRPTVGTPVGGKPAVGAPASTRPSIGTPVGAKPAVGTPVGGRPAVGSPAVGASRPAVSSPVGGRPTGPAKPAESKQDISRRNFMRGLVIVGGLVALVQFGALGPFLEGSVASTTRGLQAITDSITNAPITASTFDDPSHLDWVTFVYPASGNPDIDADTFRQCVAIRLPAGFTAPANVSATDSSGNIYVGFSRVCVHLWCLWSYVATDMRMECPCHGSQYVPGSGTYPNLPIADNKPPGLAVEGPASLQTPPNNMLPIITLKINSDGTFSATGIIGQVGCGQDC